MTAQPNDALRIQEIYLQVAETRDRIEAFGLTQSVFYEPTPDVRTRALMDMIFMPVYRVCEETSNLSYEFARNHPEIPWDQIRGMRNRMAHAYFTFDPRFLWDVVQNDFPALEKLCKDYAAAHDLELP